MQDYDILDAKDIQNALKDLLDGATIEMMEVDKEHLLWYEKYERTDSTDEVWDYRNDHKTNHDKFSFGSMDIEISQDYLYDLVINRPPSTICFINIFR